MSSSRSGFTSMLTAIVGAVVLGRRLAAGLPLFATEKGGRFRRMKEKKKGGGGNNGGGKMGKKGKGR